MTSPSPSSTNVLFGWPKTLRRRNTNNFAHETTTLRVILCSISNLLDDFQTSIWIKKTRTNFNFKMYRSLNFDKSYFYKQHEIFKVWANRIFQSEYTSAFLVPKIFNLLMNSGTLVYLGVRNVSFLEYVVYVPNGWSHSRIHSLNMDTVTRYCILDSFTIFFAMNKNVLPLSFELFWN